MKINALITTLILGTSSLALAAPTVRDHRTLPAPAPVVQARAGFAWHKPIARPLLLANNTHVAGRSVISVAPGTRAFTRLELKGNSGRTNIDRVLITFGNGQTQIINLAGKLNGVVNAGKSVTIDLAGNARFIKTITLVGKSGRRASIDVLAV